MQDHGLEVVATFALLVYMAVTFGGCSYLLVRFRRRAENLNVRARSPTLATFPGIYAIVVGGLLIPLQLLLQLNGVGYPCLLSLIQSWFFLPLWGAPFALRSLRVIIATNKGRHERFGVFLRKRTTLAMEGFLCMVALAIVAMLSLFLEPYSDGWATSRGAPRGGQCFMMMEWKLLLPFCVLQTVLFGILGFRLSNVHDLLNISSELRVNFMLYLFFGLPYFVLQLHYRYRTNEAVPTYFQLLISVMVVLAMLNTMWLSIGGFDMLQTFLGMEGSSADSDGTVSTVASSTGRHFRVSEGGQKDNDGGGSPSDVLARVTSRDISRWKRHYHDVPTIMRSKRMSTVFGALANRFLCSESYEFLVAVSDYKASTAYGAGPGLQHLLYTDICKAFILVNSEQEVNISSEQRDDVLQYKDYRAFSRLSEEAKRGVFSCAEVEVLSMLELNLLETFYRSAAFKETCAAVDVEEHVWQLEEQVLFTDNNRSGGGDGKQQ